MPLKLEPVDLNAVITEVADLVGPGTPRHRIRLRLDRELPPVQADRDKLTQVVTNLVSNAVKYSAEGGEIVITSCVRDGFARVSVRDHGVGIPEEALEAVFERYSRIESGAGGRVPGTGLGLPIVREIVKLHRGEAWAESSPGQDSVFHFTIPAAGASRAAPEGG